MDRIYIGTPTIDEIRIYLSDMQYSLLNNPELKQEIISFQKDALNRIDNEEKILNAIHINYDSSENIIKLKIKNKRVPLAEKTNKQMIIEDKTPIQDDQIAENDKKPDNKKVDTKKNKKVRTIRRKVLTQKERNRITKINTQKNRGYKTIKLKPKVKTIFYEKADVNTPSSPDKSESFHNRKVKFIESDMILDHNPGEPVPIIKETQNRKAYKYKGKIETVIVENVIFVPKKTPKKVFAFKKEIKK